MGKDIINCVVSANSLRNEWSLIFKHSTYFLHALQGKQLDLVWWVRPPATGSTLAVIITILLYPLPLTLYMPLFSRRGVPSPLTHRRTSTIPLCNTRPTYRRRAGRPPSRAPRTVSLWRMSQPTCCPGARAFWLLICWANRPEVGSRGGSCRGSSHMATRYTTNAYIVYPG